MSRQKHGVCVHMSEFETLQEVMYNTGVELLVASCITGPQLKVYVKDSLSKISHFSAAPISCFWFQRGFFWCCAFTSIASQSAGKLKLSLESYRRVCLSEMAQRHAGVLRLAQVADDAKALRERIWADRLQRGEIEQAAPGAPVAAPAAGSGLGA